MLAFLSYSHVDFKLKRRFVEHFAALQRLYGINLWHDDRLKEHAGQVLDSFIGQAITAAQLHLILVTPAMFNSDYIWNIELPAMKESASVNNGLLVPIILKDALWQALVSSTVAIPLDENNNLKPITNWRPDEKGFVAMARQLEATVLPHFGLKPRSPLSDGL